MRQAASDATHVAFLRAINVGGRRLAMGALVDACRKADVDVRATWQGTGNLVIAADAATVEELADRVERALLDELALVAPTIVRTVEQVRAVAAAAPFSEAELTGTERRVQVLLLRDPVAEAVRAAVAELVPDEDLVRWSDQEMWWLPRRGVATSSLPVRRVEGLLGTATMRGHRAIRGLVARHLEG